VWHAGGVALRALIVDDHVAFIDAASRLLSEDGIEIVGAASTSVEAVELAERLQPDVVLIDIQLGPESGFDLARRLAGTTDAASMIVVSTHAEADFADLVAVSPVLGFLSKSDFSGGVIRDLLEDRAHGHGCRHEALVYSSSDELVAAATPFARRGLAADEVVLVVMREPGRALLRDALAGEASRIEFADAGEWYRSPQHAFEEYRRYIHGRLDRGADRVRVVAEVIPPAVPADWNRYEAEITVAMAAVPVSFVCAYDTRELHADLVAAASRTHPLLRGGDGPRPSPHYTDPAVFVRELG
jgi:DNA-binding NarL/FixJ family response regulator